LRIAFCLLLSAFCLLFSGCRRAEVEPHAPKVETRMTTGDPPYAMRRANDPPWYSDLQVLMDERPADEKELQQHITEHREEVKAALLATLNEILKSVEDQRHESDKWSVLAMTAGRSKHANEIHFTADVGLTRLYAHRPVINITDVPLDLCIAKLCREAGIQDAQTRGHNPTINWEKNDVAAYDALQAIVPSHGFELKFANTFYHLEMKAQDYNSRKEFIDAISSAIMAKAKDLNNIRAAVVIAPRQKQEKTEASSEKPTDVKPPDVKAPEEPKSSEFTAPNPKAP
jgi:hypothetical protein